MSNAERIKGRIIAYSDAVKAGTVIGHDKNTYLFMRKDWGSEREPEIDLKILFIAEMKSAKSVIADEG